MRKDEVLPTGPSGLPCRVKEQLQSENIAAGLCPANEEPQGLIHELQVHRVELEMQTEGLGQARAREAAALEKYITERRRVEVALTERCRELEKINLSLVQALDELRRKEPMMIMQGRNAAMGEMINSIAHHWRQPLNALGLIIQQIPLFYGSVEFNREFLEENFLNAMQLIQHMSRTIDDFRNFFRSDKERTVFSVNQAIKQTVSLIEESFKAQKIRVAFHTESDPIITGYPNEYAQVLLSILLNARDALVERNIEDPRISLRTFIEGNKTVVTITDNAGGIAEEIMDKVFDPYFTSKGPDKGMGIGLFMAKTIIEKNMGGRMTVQNTGNCAEFRIEV